MSYDSPLKVTIPAPSAFSVRRGIHSTGGYGGNLRIRCTNAEYDMIQNEAAQLGLSLAGFCRWSAVRVAEAMLSHRNENSSDIEGTHDGVKE